MDSFKPQTIIGCVILVLVFTLPGFTQGGHMGGYYHPDSLTVVTVSGTAMVDSSMMHPMYYLDEDGDQQADYHLNFGPYWYEPDSSNATRPNDGDQITIVGDVLNRPTLPMVVMFEINGLVWRDSTQFGPNFGGGWIYANMNTSKQIHTPFDPEDWMNVNPGWHQGGGGDIME